MCETEQKNFENGEKCWTKFSSSHFWAFNSTYFAKPGIQSFLKIVTEWKRFDPEFLRHIGACFVFFFIENGGKRKNKKNPQIPMIGTYALCLGWRLTSSMPQPRPRRQGHLRGLHIKFQKNWVKNAVSASIWISNIWKSLFFKKNIFAIENSGSG